MGKDEVRGWVGIGVAEAEVFFVGVQEEENEREDCEDRDTEQDEDEEKIWFLRGYLLDFHEYRMLLEWRWVVVDILV